AVDIARGHRAGVFLAPLGDRRRLARALVRAPRALAVSGGEAGVAALHHERDAARGRIVVVALVEVAEGVHRLLVAVAVVVPDDLHVRAVGIHPRGKAADPDAA